MTADLRLGVSVLTHNAGASINEVIGALKRQTTHPLSTVIIDNGSSDDTVRRCRENGLTVRCQSNLGVGAGHLAGLRELFADERIDFVLLLEHDSVLTATCIQNLVSAIELLEARQLRVGAIACRVLHPIENATRLNRIESADLPVALHPAHRITFNGLLISWDAFALAGGPRSDFFVGQEDSDLFRRFRRAGVPVRTANHAVVAHSGKGRSRRGEGLPSTRGMYSIRNSTYRDMHLDAHSIRGAMRLGKSMLQRVMSRSDDSTRALVAARSGFAGRLGPVGTGGRNW